MHNYDQQAKLRHTVSESTEMSFILSLYSWDFRHEHERKNNMLHLFLPNKFM